MKVDLSGLRALVTGSTKGIGRAIAQALAQNGAEVAINGRKAADVDQAIATIRAALPTARLVPAPGDVATVPGASDVVGFAQLTGDRNPIHPVGAFRREDLVPHAHCAGPCTPSLISAVLGTRLPGPGVVYISQTLNFRAPVKIGDAVVVTVTVAELIPEKSRRRLSCLCEVHGEVVLDGEALVKVPGGKPVKDERPSCAASRERGASAAVR